LRDERLPLTQTVLYRGKLGELTLPVWEDTKRLDIAILVEITVVASDLSDVPDVAVFEVECGVLARIVVRVVVVKVGVVVKAPGSVWRTLPLDLVLFNAPGSGRV
jgi:hypothetical protein